MEQSWGGNKQDIFITVIIGGTPAFNCKYTSIEYDFPVLGGPDPPPPTLGFPPMEQTHVFLVGFH